ncbi:hypothetical protein B5X24_HaOG214476 [Helicoverpa armigera]|nr:hypothetical protein B5X24_HaOG214476 [Helicoverpa armigera]
MGHEAPPSKFGINRRSAVLANVKYLLGMHNVVLVTYSHGQAEYKNGLIYHGIPPERTNHGHHSMLTLPLHHQHKKTPHAEEVLELCQGKQRSS